MEGKRIRCVSVVKRSIKRDIELPVAIHEVREGQRSRCLSSLIGTLQNYDGDGKENVEKVIGLMSKTTTLHVHYALLYISLLSLHNYDVK